MLKRWRIWLFWALVIAFALWIRWWASWNFALEHQICGGPEAPNDCDSYNIIFYSAWRLAKAADHWSALLTAIATVAIALFTLTLKNSTDRLWDATNRSVEALISAENCYLFPIIRDENITKLVSTYGRWDKSDSMWESEVETPSIAFHFQNFGRTPAMLKVISNNIIVSSHFPKQAKYEIRETMPDELVIEPTKPSATLIALMKDAFTVGDTVQFQKSAVCVWFYGYVSFDDAFAREHRMDFRFCYRRGFGGFRLVHLGEWTQDHQNKEDVPPPL